MSYDVFQNSTATPLVFLLIASSDHMSGLTGASPTVAIKKNTGNPYDWVMPGGTVSELAVSSPGILTTSAASSTGGHLAQSTSYYYELTATNAFGETTVSAELTYTVGATGTGTNQVTINWPAVSGATGYKLYRGTASGGELLLATISGGGTTSYVDNSSTVPSGSPPAANTTSGGWYQVAGNATDTNTLGPILLHATAVNADVCDASYFCKSGDAYAYLVTNLGALGANLSALAAAVKSLFSFTGTKPAVTLAIADVSGNMPANVLQVAGETASATAAVSFDAIAATLAIEQGDEYIDTSTTPWNYVVMVSGAGAPTPGGGPHELLRKKLKTVAGASVLNANTIIGQNEAG